MMPIQIIERPNRPLQIGDIVVASGGIRARVVSLTPQDQGGAFQTVDVGLEPIEDEAGDGDAV